MLLGLNHTAGARLAMAAVVVILGATNGFASPSNRNPTVVVHPRYVPVSNVCALLLLPLEPLLALLDLRPFERRPPARS
jgi:energy-converting hydrogenase Eha subunit E